MTSATEMYLLDTSKSSHPPRMLLELFTNWMYQHPTMCLSLELPIALPPGAIPMPTVSPLAGLIRWCALAPIHHQPSSDTKLYGQLHLAILQCLSHVSSISPTPSNVINTLHVAATVAALQQNNASEEHLQIGLERLAQSMQLALSTRILSGNANQLLARLETLPPNTLLQIVIKRHKVQI